MSRRLPGTALLLCLLATAGILRGQAPAGASDTTLDRKVREVASTLRCPVCLNLSIQDSPSELARDMREVVRDRLSHGDNEEQVTAYFIQRYGEWVLMKPPAHGVSLLVWLLPVVVVIGGAALVGYGVRRWVRPSAPRASSNEAVPEKDLEMVRHELAKERQRGLLD